MDKVSGELDRSIFLCNEIRKSLPGPPSSGVVKGALQASDSVARQEASSSVRRWKTSRDELSNELDRAQMICKEIKEIVTLHQDIAARKEGISSGSPA